MQRSIRNYNEQLYTKKIEQPRRNGKFLETYNLPRLTHEETENLNRATITKEIESII